MKLFCREKHPALLCGEPFYAWDEERKGLLEGGACERPFGHDGACNPNVPANAVAVQRDRAKREMA